MLQAVSGVLHPYIDKEIHFKFVPTPVYEFHEPLLKVEDVDFKFEGAVNAFLHAEMCVAQRSRNIIVGENGSGKSTMMSLLGGALDPTEGAVKRVQNLNVGYFSQMVADELLQDVKDYDTPLSWMGRIHPEVTEFDMRGELSAFGIGGSKVGTTIRMMSGGERTRIILTSLMVKRPHILILDEPSNHLDLDSVHALGVGLGEWNGTIILATHDSNLVRLVMEHSPQEYEKNFYQLVSVDKKWGLGYERAVKRLEPSEFEKYWTE
jgi:ATPase subunit of ABC transporter with duplicated ATPase domains